MQLFNDIDAQEGLLASPEIAGTPTTRPVGGRLLPPISIFDAPPFQPTIKVYGQPSSVQPVIQEVVSPDMSTVPVEATAPSPIVNANVPVGAPASQGQSTSTTSLTSIGSSTISTLGTIFGDVETEVAGIVSSPTQHLVAIAVIALIAWWYFHKRRR
jgi:hypothetical protein